MKLIFENTWKDGFIPLAIVWGEGGFGICLFSFVIGVRRG